MEIYSPLRGSEMFAQIGSSLPRFPSECVDIKASHYNVDDFFPFDE